MSRQAVREAGELGALIRQARSARGMTQQELAEHLGVHRRYVSALENGHDTIALRRLLLALDVLDLQVQVTGKTATSARGGRSQRPAKAPASDRAQSGQTRARALWWRRRRSRR